MTIRFSVLAPIKDVDTIQERHLLERVWYFDYYGTEISAKIDNWLAKSFHYCERPLFQTFGFDSGLNI